MPKIITDLKQRLLEEVERLLAQGGYGAVTVRAVATGCGVGVGTVYNYFPSKEAMLAELLLKDWRRSLAAIDAVSLASECAEPVAGVIHAELARYIQNHAAVFRDDAARSSFAGSFSQYHGLLRSQLAAPLRRFCRSDFAAEFAAEALLTWTAAGKKFCEIWALISSATNKM